MAKSRKSISRSKSRSKSQRVNKRIPPRNPDGSIKISMIKREYRLVEQHGDQIVVTPHFALNKGPGDAAVKLARPFFKDRNDGSKVRITIKKISDGRNKGALYEYEVLQKHMPLAPGENAPKGIVIEKNGKRYRLKRYATKLKTYTPTSQKKLRKKSSKSSTNDKNAARNPIPISEKTKDKIKQILEDKSVRGRVSKTIKTLREDTAEGDHHAKKLSKSKKSNDATESNSSSTSDEQTHITVSDD